MTITIHSITFVAQLTTMIKDTTTTYRTSTATKEALIALAKQDGVKPSRLIDDLIGGYCKYREKNPEVKSFYKWLHK